MPRPIRAVIDTDALAHNLARARAAAPDAKVWAVIKADAYGHGIERAFTGLRSADGFALLDFAEAHRVRALGWRGPILLLEGCFEPRDLEACSRFKLWHVVHRAAQIDWLAGHKTEQPHQVFLKLNAGMNRLGFAPAAFRDAWFRLSGLTQVDGITLMTHFSNADSAGADSSDAGSLYVGSSDANSSGADSSGAALPAVDAAGADAYPAGPAVDGPSGAGRFRPLGLTAGPSPLGSTTAAAARGAGGSRLAEQVAAFEAATRDLPGERSLCNSAATLRVAPHDAAVRGDWVRPGIMVYGSAPDFPAHGIADWALRPAMSLRSELIATQQLQPGDGVGYGGTFTANCALRIGIVACGYADGYPRAAPTGTPVLVDGVRTRLVGRVSMDMLAVDLSPLPAAAPGSEVTLWGTSATGAVLPIDEVAHAAGTLGYELMCALAPRVPVSVVPAPRVRP